MMVEFNSVSFSYTENGTGAVHDISFAIPEGQFVLVCGASGCGKTTITRLINGLIPHFFSGNLSGSVRVAGMKTSATPIADISDTVGSVFQNPRTQFFNADTDSEIVFGMENRGMPVNDILERLEAVTAELNLQRLRCKTKNRFCICVCRFSESTGVGRAVIQFGLSLHIGVGASFKKSKKWGIDGYRIRAPAVVCNGYYRQGAFYEKRQD